MHYGVKGMKLGVRKKEASTDGTIRSRYQALRTRELRTYRATTKNGETVTATEVRESKIGSAISALSPKLYKQLKDGADLDFTVDGRKVGEGSLQKRSDDEMYLNWIGVKQSERGKGYASAMFDAGVEYSKNQGVKKLTLEVPGNAPDARHIYEKRGFKVTGPMHGAPTDIWGGLYPMSLDISDRSIRHVEDEALELEKAFLQHFGILYQGLNPFESGKTMEHVERGSNSLEHYGVLGMKWGRRRQTSKAQKPNDYAKEAKELSTAELKNRFERLRLENEYAKLNSAEVFNGKKIVTNFLGKAANNIAMTLVVGTITKLGQNYINQKFGV